MCDAARQLAKARHLLELMRGNGVYDIPQLLNHLNPQHCEHEQDKDNG
ncbi:hypothetical protein PP353_gp47 [Arthrobacter phage Kumotta]|uniref:Uncharacterized protein n=1 Tax=Arthrobacter phage Kumotta TaxID=2588498 RepID=A0A4Y6ENG3_9CAUD|nr:hypothetical protein PP353_gp47 [Arthrobacter phage Kumotta]QDF19557.1 hypothetical protein SEA_KUMOTTA_47 [Arthrobacter phage Kumotta]